MERQGTILHICTIQYIVTLSQCLQHSEVEGTFSPCLERGVMGAGRKGGREKAVFGSQASINYSKRDGSAGRIMVGRVGEAGAFLLSSWDYSKWPPSRFPRNTRRGTVRS